MHTTISLEIVKKLINNVAEKCDKTLLEGCKAWTLKEKNIQVLVILHLAEIGRRRLHLDQGFSSLFDYCQKVLNLSESETYLRTQVAGVCLRYPELLTEIDAGNISLTVAGRIAPYINDENKNALLQDCRGKSKRQVDEYFANKMPLPRPVSSLRKKAVVVDEVGTPEFDFNGVEKSSAPAAKPKENRATMAPLGQQRHHLHCTISDETKKNLVRLAEVLGIDSPLAHLDEVVEKALQIAVKAKDPAQKTQKTKKKPAAPKLKTNEAKKRKKREYIPKAVKNAVFSRAGYCCEFVSLQGQRCGQRTHLEIDHKHPLFLGGSNEIINLQILCSGHNRRKNEHEYGRPWVA